MAWIHLFTHTLHVVIGLPNLSAILKSLCHLKAVVCIMYSHLNTWRIMLNVPVPNFSGSIQNFTAHCCLIVCCIFRLHRVTRQRSKHDLAWTNARRWLTLGVSWRSHSHYRAKNCFRYFLYIPCITSCGIRTYIVVHC